MDGMDKIFSSLKKRKTLRLDDYTILRNQLENVHPKLSDALRDAIWKKGGKWDAAGLGGISSKEIVDYVEKIVQVATEKQV